MAPAKADITCGRTRFVTHSAAFLPEGYQLVRSPRFSWRQRGAEFYRNFEKRALFYDVFRHQDGKQVLLAGPPPRNLLPMLKRAHYTFDGKKVRFKPRFFISQSVMIIALDGVPTEADTLHVSVDDLEFSLPIQKNFADELAGKRLLFTISKDNPLAWIKAWADYHGHIHGVNALVFIDNGSTKFSLNEIAATLGASCIPEIFMVSWPYIYGAIDSGVIFYPYWTHFLQIAGMGMVLRRFGMRAAGILNCDIDELMAPPGGGTIFDELAKTPRGLLVTKGAWVETEKLKTDFGDHRDFGFRLADPEQQVCHEKKWVLDPRHNWVQNLKVHPYMHWINGRPAGSKTMSENAFFWHFKGINTNWKVERNKIEGALRQTMELDPELGEIFSRWAGIKQNRQ